MKSIKEYIKSKIKQHEKECSQKMNTELLKIISASSLLSSLGILFVVPIGNILPAIILCQFYMFVSYLMLSFLNKNYLKKIEKKERYELMLKNIVMEKILKRKDVTSIEKEDIKQLCLKVNLSVNEIEKILSDNKIGKKIEDIKNKYSMIVFLIEIEKYIDLKNKNTEELIKKQIKDFEIKKDKLISELRN